eukprot:6171155-Pyramimonas_sp.AAC.1
MTCASLHPPFTTPFHAAALPCGAGAQSSELGSPTLAVEEKPLTEGPSPCPHSLPKPTPGS